MIYWYTRGYQEGNGFGFTHKKLSHQAFPIMARYQREASKPIEKVVKASTTETNPKFQALHARTAAHIQKMKGKA